ncbi:MAG: asparaginase domain-containing protein [Patescibacteria group bacterium]
MKEDGRLHFIMTGGTIDSSYNPVKETTVPSEHSYIPMFVPFLQLYEEVEFTEVFMKDSRDITDSDRSKVLEAIEKSSSKRIIITHGSYTVAETARYVQEYLQSKDRTIIFVCSLIPIEGFAPTDAGFNLGYAVGKSQNLGEGVYVCMNGRVFSPDEVVKILETGRFASTYTK